MNTATVKNRLENQRPGTLDPSAVMEIASALRFLLADVFALYVKTKGFHWHISGRHFRDYHLLLDEQAEQIFAMVDEIAERSRKLGGATLHSIADIAKDKRLSDDADACSAEIMLKRLEADNAQLLSFLRSSHDLCAQHNDVATTGLIEVWIDQTERRVWFLSATLAQDQTHRKALE